MVHKLYTTKHLKLLNVNLELRYRYIFIILSLVSTHPNLDIVHSSFREGFAEPRWIVCGAARTLRALATHSIPERVVPVDGASLPIQSGTSLAKPVISDEWWYSACIVGPRTWTKGC